MIKQIEFGTDLKKIIVKGSKAGREMAMLYREIEKTKDNSEKEMIKTQIKSLKNIINKTNDEVKKNLEEIFVPRKLEFEKKPMQMPSTLKPVTLQRYVPQKPVLTKEIKAVNQEISGLERETIKRIRKKGKEIIEKKEKKPSNYIRIANIFFSKVSNSLLEKGYFKNMKRNLIRGNMPYLTKSYISVMFMNTLVSFIASIFLIGFFLFFNLGVAFPFITLVSGNIINRFLSIIWLILVIPLGVYLITYVYPLLEKKSIESKINQEIPFAAIHMAAISESLVEPSNIFKIIITTKEYPALEKEFTKLLNEINIFGRDLVTALRNVALNSPSKKLSELLDGMATTITTGGDLSDFFEKRAQTLLLDYRLEREKQSKSAETFMDIYISVVIAAPMILMLLLIMMRVSGLGISLSTTMISLIMVLGVSVINIVFLVFLQLKQQDQ